jgi:hypothetical protein
VRRSSSWHWTGRERDGGRRTGGDWRRAVAGLSTRVGRARERASESGRGRKWARGGGRAGRRAQKGRGGSDVAGERAVVGVSTAGRSWAGGWGRADRWGRRDRERESERTRGKPPTARTHGAARERGGEESASAKGCTDRRDPPVRQRGCAGAGARAGWAKWAALGRISFSFFLEFLIAFLFIFSRVFNSNLNQVSNSNQIKYVQHFKEYVGSI